MQEDYDVVHLGDGKLLLQLKLANGQVGCNAKGAAWHCNKVSGKQRFRRWA